MTELVQDLAWQADALELRATTELTASEIGNRVDKHPATIRKLFARNPPSVAEPTADRAMSPEEANAAFSAIPMTPTPVEEQHEGTIPGQTTVDDFVGFEVPPENDPEYEPGPAGEYEDEYAEFKAEAGEAVGPMPPVVTVTYEYEMESAMPVLKGTRQMALDLGPNAAPITESTVTFKSEKWPSGHFGMGDVVSGTFTARIVSTPGKEKFDKDMEEFVAAPMAYGALITEIEYEVGDDV